MKFKLPFRLLFLGDRRIAGEVLQMINSPDFQSVFDLRILVTSENLLEWYGSLASPQLICLKNNQRHTEKLQYLIADQQINLILSIQHNWILPECILKSVSGFAFNLHNAKLPDYKGYNSISHALINGETCYHPTLHWMAEVVDSGPIAYEGSVAIAPDDTAFSLYPRTVKESVRLVRRLFEALKTGEAIPSKELGDWQGRFYKKSDIDMLADVTGVTDPFELDRRVRAVFFPPLNTAFINVADRRYYLVPSGDLAKGWQHFKPINQPNGFKHATD